MHKNHFEPEPNHFRVDRQSPVGNPYPLNLEKNRNDVCDKYENYFAEQIKKPGKFYDYVKNILTKMNEYDTIYLYCWCAPRRCHADTIKSWLMEAYKEKK